MKEQEQLIRRAFERFIRLCYFGTVLRGVARACGDRSVHADTLMICTMPLSPSVALGRFNTWPVVRPHDVGQRSNAECAGVAFVNIPRGELHIHDRVHYQRITTEGESCPFFCNLSDT